MMKEECCSSEGIWCVDKKCEKFNVQYRVYFKSIFFINQMVNGGKKMYLNLSEQLQF